MNTTNMLLFHLKVKNNAKKKKDIPNPSNSPEIKNEIQNFNDIKEIGCYMKSQVRDVFRNLHGIKPYLASFKMAEGKIAAVFENDKKIPMNLPKNKGLEFQIAGLHISNPDRDFHLIIIHAKEGDFGKNLGSIQPMGYGPKRMYVYAFNDETLGPPKKMGRLGYIIPYTIVETDQIPYFHGRPAYQYEIDEKKTFNVKNGPHSKKNSHFKGKNKGILHLSMINIINEHYRPEKKNHPFIK